MSILETGTDFKNKAKHLFTRRGSEDDSYLKGTLGRADEVLCAKASFRLKFVPVSSIQQYMQNIRQMPLLNE